MDRQKGSSISWLADLDATIPQLNWTFPQLVDDGPFHVGGRAHL